MQASKQLGWLVQLAAEVPWRSQQLDGALHLVRGLAGCQGYATEASTAFSPARNPSHYYVPGRDVFKEFEEKWRQRAQPPAPAKLAPPKRDWLEEYEKDFTKILRDGLRLPEDVTQRLVVHAKAGLVPDNADIILQRWRELQQLERRFFGFNAQEALAAEPSLLRMPTDRVFAAMLVFQDNFSAAGAGACMNKLAHYVVEQPARLARRLHALGVISRKLLGAPLPLTCLSRTSAFLTLPQSEIEERVQACATIFGHEAALAILSKDLNLLNVHPQVLNQSIILLRKIISAGPSGDRHLVTQLVAKDPRIARLPERVDPDELQARMRVLKSRAGGLRQKGTEARAALLQQPDLLLLSADEIAAALPRQAQLGREPAAQ